MNAGIQKRGKDAEAVSRLRGHVMSGTYQVDSQVVAEAMLARVGLWPVNGGSDDRSQDPAHRRHR